MVHTGVNKINILGWDGSKTNENGQVYHFYDFEGNKEYKPNMNYIRKDINLDKFLKHDIDDNEHTIVQKAETDLKNYLKSNSIEIEILTKFSHVNKGIKRSKALYNLSEKFYEN